MPLRRLKSSLLTASARQRSSNSQDGQWEFRIIKGGEVDSICFLNLSRICLASLTSRVGSGRSSQFDLGHGEAGTVNDFDERDGSAPRRRRG